jgi:3-dehydroquinate dehydratase II
MAPKNIFPRVLVIHGPNLNMLGKREPQLYGSDTLATIDQSLNELGQKLNVTVDTFQSNHEGAIVDRIQAAFKKYDALIINPGAFTHTSVAIRDALLLLDVPIVEIHLSNIYKREPFRHHSFIADIATGQISGLGARGYLLALEAVAHTINPK